jgi:hypothetical protein
MTETAGSFATTRIPKSPEFQDSLRINIKLPGNLFEDGIFLKLKSRGKSLFICAGFQSVLKHS